MAGSKKVTAQLKAASRAFLVLVLVWSMAAAFQRASSQAALCESSKQVSPASMHQRPNSTLLTVLLQQKYFGKLSYLRCCCGSFLLYAASMADFIYNRNSNLLLLWHNSELSVKCTSAQFILCPANTMPVWHMCRTVIARVNSADWFFLNSWRQYLFRCRSCALLCTLVYATSTLAANTGKACIEMCWRLHSRCCVVDIDAQREREREREKEWERQISVVSLGIPASPSNTQTPRIFLHHCTVVRVSLGAGEDPIPRGKYRCWALVFAQSQLGALRLEANIVCHPCWAFLHQPGTRCPKRKRLRERARCLDSGSDIVGEFSCTTKSKRALYSALRQISSVKPDHSWIIASELESARTTSHASNWTGAAYHSCLIECRSPNDQPC